MGKDDFRSLVWALTRQPHPQHHSNPFFPAPLASLGNQAHPQISGMHRAQRPTPTHTRARVGFLCRDPPGPWQQAQSLLARSRSFLHTQSKRFLCRQHAATRAAAKLPPARFTATLPERGLFPSAADVMPGSCSLFLPNFSCSVQRAAIAPGLCASRMGLASLWGSARPHDEC